MNTKTDNAENRSLHPPARPPEGQMLNQPTVAGWWWVLAYDDAHNRHFDKWYALEVVERDGEIGHEYDDGSFIAAGDGRSLWVGPLTPPGWTNVRMSDAPPKPSNSPSACEARPTPYAGSGNPGLEPRADCNGSSGLVERAEISTTNKPKNETPS